MFNEKHISKWLIFLPIVSIVITTLILVNLFIDNTKVQHLQEIEKLEAQELAILKNTLQQRVERIINIIHLENEQRYESHVNEIKNVVSLGYDMLKQTYEENKNLPKEQILQKIKNRLRNIRFFKNSSGYFYIHSLDGICIMMPPNKNIEGTNLRHFQAQDGTYIFRGALDQVSHLQKLGQQDGTIVHYIPKPNQNSLKKKIGYIKIFEPLGIFVGTGKYYEDLLQNTQEEILSLINNLQFERRDFAFATTKDGVLLEESKQDALGKKIDIASEIASIKTTILRSTTLVDGEYVTYQAKHPINKKIFDKITYVKYYQPYEWVIGSGAFLDSIKDNIAFEKNKLIKESEAILHNITLFSIGVIILMVIILIPISYKIKNMLFKREKALDKKNEELYHTIYHDELTTLFNRNQLIKDIVEKKSSSLILIDIDNFSQINDIYGLEVGDKILKSIANTITTIAPKESKVYRVTNDIFALLNHDSKNSKQKASSVAYTIIEIINENSIEIVIDDFQVDIVLSATLSMAEEDGSNKLFEHANMALNFAKMRKKPFVIYSAELGIEKRYQDDLYSVMITKKALQNDLIVPYFQPIIKHDGKIAYESLVRIVDDGTVIMPASFINKIKTTKYYNLVTRAMIVKTFEYFKDKPYSFSINFSFEDISDSKLFEFLKAKIKEYSMEKKFVIEIVESESIQNFEVVNSFVQNLRKLGVRIAIDDFGSGYSNFSYLLKLSPDYIKIDGSLIRNIDRDRKSYIIVKNIISFSKELGVEIIAEFIHSQEVYSSVKNLGAHGFQGYLFGAPQREILN